MWLLTILCWSCTVLTTLSQLDLGKEGKEDQYPLDHFPLTCYILMCAALVVTTFMASQVSLHTYFIPK